MTAPTLTVHSGGIGSSWDAGDELLNDLFDLIASRLAGLANDDPVRGIFRDMLPAFARQLGRPVVELVDSSRVAIGSRSE